MRKGIIYRATSPSGKKYYGRTIQTLTQRKYKHNACARGKSYLYFHNAIRKYGEENILWEVIETYEHEDKKELIDILNKLEIFYIDKDETLHPNGYNLNKGGGNYSEGLGNRIGKTYEEYFGKEKAALIKQKQKQSMIGKNVGRIQTKEEIQKRVIANIGKKRTDETKNKISIANKGKKRTAAQKKNISNALKGNAKLGLNFGNKIFISEETKTKIIYLHIHDFLLSIEIAKIVNLNYQRVKLLLKNNNSYIDYSKLRKLREKNISVHDSKKQNI